MLNDISLTLSFFFKGGMTYDIEAPPAACVVEV